MHTHRMLAISLAFGLTMIMACSGQDGAQGPEGQEGPEGRPGTAATNPLVDLESLTTGDATCPGGGVVMRVGLDLNDNGVLDSGEVSDQEWICNGPQGTPGSDDLVVTTDTITVGASGDFATLPEALDSLGGKIIPPDLTVTINVESATYVFTSGVDLNHPNGDRIQIIGDIDHPDQVVFDFGANYGFNVTDGHSIGLIDGVTIMGDGAAAASGVIAQENSTVGLGESVIVESFGGSGVMVSTGGYIFAVGVISRDNGQYGFRASAGIIRAQNSLAENNTAAGYYADANGTIGAGGATATGNAGNGFYARNGSYIDASASIATGNGDGYLSMIGSTITARGALSSGNAVNGFKAVHQALIDAVGTTVVCNNGVRSFTPAPNVEGGNNSWIVTDGDLVDNGTGACP